MLLYVSLHLLVYKTQNWFSDFQYTVECVWQHTHY